VVLASAVACSSDSGGGGTATGGTGAIVDGGSGSAGTAGKSGGGGTGGTGATGGVGGSSGSSVSLPAGCWNGTAQCNPVTNEGCPGAGEACDLAGDGSGATTLSCFPDGNTEATGAPCDQANGPWCQATNTCIDPDADGGAGMSCHKYCCDSADCPTGTNCMAFDQSAGTLGFCLGSGTGGTGGTDAGTGGTAGSAGTASDAAAD
jgi:hypothetical protein